MIEIYRIAVSKDKLRAMPKDERAFMLLLGYSANQVSMLQKLLMFSAGTMPPTDTEKVLSAAQTQILLRLTIGALHETWRMIKTRYIKGRIGKDYQSLLDSDGLAALENLKRLDGKSNLISGDLRNTYSFHFPDDTDAVDAAFDDSCNDPDADDLWSLYFSHYGFNSQFVVSDLIVLHGVSRLTKEANPAASQEKIMKAIHETAVNLFEFSKAFFAATWLKNFGQVLDSDHPIKIANPPAIRNVSIPFFVDMDG